MTPNDLKKLYPNCSSDFLKLHLPDQPVVAALSHPLPERHGGREPLGLQEAQGPGQGRALVCITRYSTRSLDKDNLVGGVKPLCDALRASGLLRDDDPDSMLLSVRQRRVKTKAETGTEIIIHPLNPKP